MKLSIKKTTKHVVMVAVASLIVGSGVTFGVFAAIPDSTNGVITACRADADGALRAIDAQEGATCGTGETSLTWDSKDNHTALARFDVDSEDSTAVVYNSSKSRNITQATMVDAPNGTKFVCMQVSFDPETSTITQGSTQGINSSTSISDVRLASQGSNITAMVNYYCGNGYNAIARYDTTLSSANSAAIAFQD